METCIEKRVNSGELSLETILSEGLEIPDHPDYRIMKEGFVVSLKKAKPRVLKEAYGGYNRNYAFVVLCHKGKPKPCNIHTLVAKAFLHIPEGKTQVNHKDGNTKNNHVDNLEWVTPQENSQHAVATGLSLTGENCPWSVHSEETVRAVCEMLQEGKDTTSIRLALGLSSKFICKIKSRVNWKQVSKEYDF